MAKDFRASQIETSKIIASGSLQGVKHGTSTRVAQNLGIMLYSGSDATNREGGIPTRMLDNVGSDVFFFVSGSAYLAAEETSTGAEHREHVTLFGGDVVISGTLYAERQIIEVDSSVPGNFHVTGNVHFQPDSDSTSAVVMENAAGTSTIFNLDSTNKRIGINDTTPDAILDIVGQTGAVPTLRIEHVEDTVDAIDIEADAITTANVIDVTADALTTGKLMNLVSDSNSTGIRELVKIHNDNTAAVNTIALNVKNDAIAGNSTVVIESTAEETNPLLELINSNAATDKPPILAFNRADTSAEADDMSIGTIQFKASDDGNNPTTYASIEAIASDITNNDEGAKLTVKVLAGGTAGTAASTDLLSIGGEDVANSTVPAVVVNDAGINCDFRIESDNDTHMVFVDASSDSMSIGVSTDAPTAVLEIAGDSAQAKPTLTIIHAEDTNNAVEITADSVTSARVVNISADALTTGAALNIDDNSAATNTRSTAQITQNNAAATGATALSVQSDGGTRGIFLDKNFSSTSGNWAIEGISVDLDKTGATDTNNTVMGVVSDVRNSTATDGTNTFVGLYGNVVLTHASDAGTPTSYGVFATATGGTNGTSKAIGGYLEAQSADVNTGLEIKATAGADDSHVKLLSSADTDDLFKIAVGAAGATTITTIDDGGEAANLSFAIDGAADIQSYGAVTIDSSNSTIGIGTDAVDQSINVGTGGDRSVTVGKSGGTSTVAIYSKGGTLTLDGTGQTVDINSNAFDVDAAAAVTIDGVGTSNVTTNGALTVSGSTGLNLHSHGGEIDITATQGNIDINATAGTLDIDVAGALTIDSATSIAIGTNADKPIDIDSTTLEIAASDAITIDGTSTFSIDGVGTSNVTTNGALTISGSTGLNLHSHGGEIDITSTVGAVDVNAAGAITLDAALASEFNTSAGAITIDGKTGITLQENNATIISISNDRDVITTNTRQIHLDASGVVNLNSSGGVISIGNDNINQNINIGTDGTRTIQIGAGDGTTTTTINSRAGNLTLDGTGQTVDLNSAALDIDASGAITIDSTSTFSVDAIGTSNVTTNGALTVSGSTLLDIRSDSGPIIAGGSEVFGTGAGKTSFGSDVKIMLSGTIGSRGSAIRGTTSLTGDANISGSFGFSEVASAPSASPDQAILYAKDVSGVTKLFSRQSDGVEIGPLGAGGSLDDGYDTPPGGGTKGPGLGAIITVDDQPVQIKVAGSSKTALAITGSVLIGSGANGTLPVMPGADTNFFVSGSILSKGTIIAGTSIFGGDLVVSGNLHAGTIKADTDIVIEVPGDIALDTDAGNVYLKDSGTTFLGFQNASNDAIIYNSNSNKDIIFKGNNGAIVEILRIDVSAKDILMAAGNNVSFGASSRYIGDGTDFAGGTANDVVIQSSNGIITAPGAGSRTTIGLGSGTGGAVEFSENNNGNNILMLTESNGSAILSSSVHNNDIIFHGNSAKEMQRFDTDVGSVKFMDPVITGNDTNFIVSGSIDSRGTVNRGTAVFGGDVVVSGSLLSKKLIDIKTFCPSLNNSSAIMFLPNPNRTAASATNINDHTNMLMPFSGSLIKMTMDVQSACTIGISLHKAQDTTALSHFTASFSNNEIKEFNFKNGFTGSYTDNNISNTWGSFSGSYDFNPGEQLALGFQKKSGSTPGTSNINLVFEYDVVSKTITD